jgi:hypothetical protein
MIGLGSFLFVIPSEARNLSWFAVRIERFLASLGITKQATVNDAAVRHE